MPSTRRSGTARASSIFCAGAKPTSISGAPLIAGIGGARSTGSQPMPPRREEPRRLGTIPERLRRPLMRCARGEQPANVALTHLLMAARNGAEIAAALDAMSENAKLWDRRETDHLSRLRDLWAGTHNALALVKKIT